MLTLSTTLLFGSYIGIKASKSESELINYYNDGVYDTISQISKEIEEGINRDEIKGATGKIAILTPLQNISTVELIFYKTTAAKINLFNATTVLDESGMPYMLWDLKQREVDSQFVTQKLTERNIPVTTKTVNADNRFFREPVLIRDFIEKVKTNIRDVDTKVAVVEKKIYTKEEITKFPPVEVEEKVVFNQPIPKNKEFEQNKIDNAPKYNNISFSANTSNASKNLRVGKNNTLFYKINKVQKNIKMGEFTISDVRLEETPTQYKYFITYEEDPIKQEFLLYSHKKPENKEVSKGSQEVKAPVKKAEETKKINSQYKCDFKNIKMATDKSGNAVKIDSGSLYYNKVVTLEAVKKIGSNFLMTNTIGLPEILLSERYINNESYCSKVN